MKRWGKAHPNSVEGSADPATLKKINEARREANEKVATMDDWARNGFTSGPWPEDENEFADQGLLDDLEELEGQA